MRGEYDAYAMIMQSYRSGIRIPLLWRSLSDLLEVDISAGDEIIDRSDLYDSAWGSRSLTDLSW